MPSNNQQDYLPDEYIEPVDLAELEDIFEQHLGMSFSTARNDVSGCYGAGGVWISPKVITQLVTDLLDPNAHGLFDTEAEDA